MYNVDEMCSLISRLILNIRFRLINKELIQINLIKIKIVKNRNIYGFKFEMFE